MSILWFFLIGAISGWVAGQLMKGRGFGVLGNIVVGVIGAILGGYLFNLLDISAGSGLLGSLVTAVAGAVVLLFIIGLIKKS